MRREMRITGTAQECADAVHVLRLAFAVREASAFRPNHGDSRLGRVYVDVDPPAATDQTATSPRIEPPATSPPWTAGR